MIKVFCTTPQEVIFVGKSGEVTRIVGKCCIFPLVDQSLHLVIALSLVYYEDA